jgi:hypothetical protein
MHTCEINVYKMHVSKRHAYERHTPMIAREIHAPVRIGAGEMTTLLAVKT